MGLFSEGLITYWREFFVSKGVGPLKTAHPYSPLRHYGLTEEGLLSAEYLRLRLCLHGTGSETDLGPKIE